MKKNLESLKDAKIGIIGDLILDCYIEGKVSRVSPEAPIPVVDRKNMRFVPGGAANVCKNIADFGNKFEAVGVVGEDSHAETLRGLFETNGCKLDQLVTDALRPTTVKTRIIGNGQQIVRIDHESVKPISREIEEQIIRNIQSLPAQVDSVVIADYSKGLLTENVVNSILELSQAGVKVIVDPHPKNNCTWRGVHTLKPNLQELKNLSGIEIDLSDHENPLENPQLNQAVDSIMSTWGIKNLMVTLSEHGMVLIGDDGTRYWEPTQAIEVFDVSGAGDTAITFYSLAVAAGWDTISAVKLANCASGLVVQKRGTATVEFAELKHKWEQ